jgi:hypothetical protein
MASNEEIDLNSGAPINKTPRKEEQPKDTKDDDINHMDVSVSDLSGIITPGMSNEELVTRLIGASEDQLIPWEECHLPSKGLYYGWPDGMVMVRAMGQAAEKVLATQRLAQSGQSIDYLFRECCKFPNGFDPVDLLLGDRVFLLYYIRGITHGNFYEFAVTCPNTSCGAVSTHTYDLNDLARTITWSKPEAGGEPFRIVLPYMSKAVGREFWVGVRFLRGYDANDILAKRKMKQKMTAKPGGGVKTKGASPFEARKQRQAESQAIDDSITDNMSKIIVSVFGVTDQLTIRQFVDKMHAQDTATVRDWLKDNTPGIDTTVTVTCPECSTEFTVELPITENFFRPSKR